jgi:hypothetical protein
MQQRRARIAPNVAPALQCGRASAYNSVNVNPDTRNAPMTRTPTTFVTANAIAARAFAWDIAIDAHHSGRAIALPMYSPLLP